MTAPTAYDLVVPSPVVSVALDRDPATGEVRWKARYGRSPEEIWGYPVHLRSEHTGKLEAPPGHETCLPLVARLPSAFEDEPFRGGALEPVDGEMMLADAERGVFVGPPAEASRAPAAGCAYVVTTADGAIDHLVFLDLDGRVIHEQELPAEFPLGDSDRWEWALMAPFVDIGLLILAVPLGIAYALGMRD